jgi:aspartyl protease family protein
MAGVSGDDRMDAAFYAIALILPLSALLARRLPWRRTAMLALIWTAIFGGGALIASLGRHGFADGWERLTASIRDDDQQVTGGTIRIRMAEDGHFWAIAQINGVERRMLIDSGATTTALSVATAKAANIDTDGDFPTILNTANGTVAADVATADTVNIGPIVARQLHVVVSPAFGDADVLGMNFLSRLAGWRVEGKTLVLTAVAVKPD